MISTDATRVEPGLTWTGGEPPDLPRPGPVQKLRMVGRALALVTVTYLLMIPVLLLKLTRLIVPNDGYLQVVRLWGKVCLWLCGVRLNRVGTPLQDGGAMVANHAGWLDIFSLLSADRIAFVSKDDVARWPVVGILSRQIGTIYISRKRSAAARSAEQLEERLLQGGKLCFFPEGTSTDGQRVLRFRSSLFSPFLSPRLQGRIEIQPVTVAYHPANGLPATFYGWWGDMALGGHLQAIFALSGGGRVDVVFHTPVSPQDFADRKALAAYCENTVRNGLRKRLELPQNTF